MRVAMTLAAVVAIHIGGVQATEGSFTRAELVVRTKPMAEAYLKILQAEAPESPIARRISRVFLQMVEHARPFDAESEWQLVLVAKDILPPFALPDGRIFVSSKWVTARRLSDAEIALLLAHEMAHVIADHMLKRLSAIAAARPGVKMRLADVLRMLEHEWYLARELEPLMQRQETEADRIGMAIVCAAGVPSSRALTLFDKMARRESGTSYVKSHDAPAARKAALIDWVQAESAACVD